MYFYSLFKLYRPWFFPRFFSTSKTTAVSLLNKIHMEEGKISPKIKSVTKDEMPDFSLAKDEISEAVTFKGHPTKFMKYMDTSMEKFFYVREYNLENFNFYLQVLSSQYKAEEAQKAIERMQMLGIEPDSTSYALLMTSFAKLKNIDKVEEIMEEGKISF